MSSSTLAGLVAEKFASNCRRFRFRVSILRGMLQPRSIAEDLRAARAGDRATIDRLLNELRPWLERVAARYGEWQGADASSADLVQEVSLQAWLKLAQFHGHDDQEQEISMFRGWLEQIVQRLAQNRSRHAHAQRRRPAGPLVSLDAAQPPAAGKTASSVAAEAEAARDVRAAIADLPDATDRLIIHECFFVGRSLRDLSDELNIDRETLGRRFHSLLDGLRDKLKGHF
jgi:RNA polymerase sigma factor (sigma-70 family)